MPRITRLLTRSIGAALLVAPLLASAQPGRGPDAPRRPEPRGPMPGGVSALLNARRQLDLTPRQVAQLDSLERIQFNERRQLNERLRGERDSLQVRLRARAGEPSPAFRDSLRAQSRARQEAMRPVLEQRRTRDSALNAAADRVLNDTQRQRVREMQAERRGYERGMRESRGQRDGMRNGRGDRGLRGGRPGQGIGRPGGDGVRGQMGPRGGPEGRMRPPMPDGGPRRPMPLEDEGR